MHNFIRSQCKVMRTGAMRTGPMSIRPISSGTIGLQALLMILSLLLLSPTAHAYTTCDGKIIPPGKVCCQGGVYCEPGYTCGSGNDCIPNSSPRACGGGKFCEKGYVCAPEGGCLPTKSPRYCGERKFCKSGQACIDNGTNCISVTSDRYCGEGKYCDPGYICTANNKCTLPSVPGSSNGSGANDARPGDVDPKNCIGIGGGDNAKYTIRNNCTYGVRFKLRTMDFSPRVTSDDSYYLGAGDDMITYSYFSYRPDVLGK